jgi:hypothetical protein
MQVQSSGEKPEVKPKPNCKWCYGRGYEGVDFKTKQQVVCRCITKQLLKDASGSPSGLRRLGASSHLI